MIYEKVIGRLGDRAFEGKNVDRIDVEWFETRNRQLRKRSSGGRDVAMRFEVPAHGQGLRPGDVIGVEADGTVIAVEVPPCAAIAASVAASDLRALYEACYEIGNRHAPLFLGAADTELLTPYDGPMMELLEKIKGVTVEVRQASFDFSRRISNAAGHGHHHEH